MLRSPLRAPQTDEDPWPGRIVVHHPAYSDGGNSLLLNLRGSDSSSGAIYHDFALFACAIIADNRFDGYFSLGRGDDAPRLPRTMLLEPGTYYFHVPQASQSSPYPVLPSFRHWKFPSDLGIYSNVFDRSLIPRTGGRDGCVITEQKNGTEQAHVIPDGETQWFFDNGMQAHFVVAPSTFRNTHRSYLEHPENMVTLRADLHRIWDRKRFVFFPKRNNEYDDPRMVFHCLDGDAQLLNLYHNRLMPNLVEAAPAMFLARVAWAIFPLDAFLLAGSSRFLRTRTPAGSGFEDTWHAADDVVAFLDVSRSSSPKKRKSTGSRTSMHTSVSGERYKCLRRSSDSGLSSSCETDGERGRSLTRGRGRARRAQACS